MSGAVIGMGRVITRTLHQKIQLERQAEVLVCFAAGLGATTVDSCARPTVTAATPMAVTTSAGSVVRPSDLPRFLFSVSPPPSLEGRGGCS